MTEIMTKEARYDRAIALRDEGKIEDAVSELERLVADEPDFALAHLGLAVFYGRLERFDDSVREASRACELSPDNSFYFTALSSLAIKGGHRKEAEEALAKAQEARFAAVMKKYREEYPEETKENAADQKTDDATEKE